MRNKLIALTLSYTKGLLRRVLKKWVAIWLSVLVVSPCKWIADMLETPLGSTFVYRSSTQSSTTNDSDFQIFTWEFVVFESWKENEHKFSWRTIANRNLIKGVYGENLLLAYNIFVLVVWYLTTWFLKNVLFAITNLEIWIMKYGNWASRTESTKALSTYLIHSKQRVQLCMIWPWRTRAGTWCRGKSLTFQKHINLPVACHLYPDRLSWCRRIFWWLLVQLGPRA